MVKLDSNNQPEMKMDEINQVLAENANFNLTEPEVDFWEWADMMDVVEDFVPPEYRDFFSEV